MTIRNTGKTILWIIASLLCATHVSAQDFPNRPVKIVVGYPPGGAVDANARILGQLLSEHWKQPVVIENRGGAGSTIGTGTVARSPADGYTLLLASPAHAINATLYKNLTFDTATAFAPVAKISLAPLVLLLHPSVQAQSVAQLIALAKAQPGKLNYGSSGVGTSVHLAGALFNMMAGTSMQHIPYQGGGPAITALLAGDTQLMFAGIEGLAHAKAGKLRALAITSAQRAELFGDIPTIAESGLPGFDVESWYGLYAPAATPQSVVAQISQATNQVLKTTAAIERFRKLGFEVFQSTPEQFSDFNQSELKRWREVIQSARATLD
jgi:tripartite-type tricarboxylate transporter receptor subunit TctC